MGTKTELPNWTNEIEGRLRRRKRLRVRICPKPVKDKFDLLLELGSGGTLGYDRSTDFYSREDVQTTITPYDATIRRVTRDRYPKRKSGMLVYANDPIQKEWFPKPEPFLWTHEIAVGVVTYSLRVPLTWCFAFVDGTWQAFLDGFSPQFIGIGDSISQARDDFSRRIHSSFQALVKRRPFQMTEEQLETWKFLDQRIDVEKYRDSVPLTLTEIGILGKVTSLGWEVIWLDDERGEEVTLHQVPASFAGFQRGDWFEALVERDPKTYSLRKILSVQPRDPITPMTEEEFQEWLDQLPSGENLPKSGSDWTTL